MQVNDIINKEEFLAIVISELKNIGVKYRKEKKPKPLLEKHNRKKIFRTSLHLLELTDVILVNGAVVQIPQFVAEACSRILDHVDVEGIFRKAGSSIRQKEIRISLEAGLPLGKTHHVIDVANVVKYFFRELPEPLVPTYIQETFLRSLLVGENNIRATLLSCLLLPQITLNTLSFFMQFLYTVSSNCHLNKMSVENLAIIFTPGLMPCPNINSHRFNNHLKIIQLLIQNANSIGSVPENIVNKIQISNITKTPSKSKSFDNLLASQKKKKKRRSDMFNGFKKIVGSAIGSSENLDNSTENKMISTDALASDQEQCQTLITPCIKSSKKRKFTEPVCAFSAKKKRDLLALLPSNTGGLLPNTPMTKETKKSRLSLGGNRNMKNLLTNPVSSMERRWSIVGTGWQKQNKNKYFDMNIGNSKCGNDEIDTKVQKNILKSTCEEVKSQCVEVLLENNIDSNNQHDEFINNEYEAIKERVTAIETRISQEFNSIRRSLKKSNDDCLDTSNDNDDWSCGPDRVQNKYERIKEETQMLSSPGTEQLAQRLNRDLKIRRSVDQVIRSPSARKIGTMRRRSQEKIRLSRNPTWHMSSTSDKKPISEFEPILTLPKSHCFYKKISTTSKQTFINQPLVEQVDDINSSKNIMNAPINEEWTSGEIFFNKLEYPPETVNRKLNNGEQNSSPKWTMQEYNETPIKRNENKLSDEKNIMCTPMLPPKSVPRKHITRTPISALRQASASKNIYIHKATPSDEDGNGRASIARLRTQNAGMVLAKAKLFDGLGGNQNAEQSELSKSSESTQIAKFNLQTPVKMPQLQIAKIEKERISKNLLSPKSMCNKHIIKSPGSITKRHRTPLSTKLVAKNVLSTIISDEQITQFRNANERRVGRKDIASPRMNRINIKSIPISSPKRITQRARNIVSSKENTQTMRNNLRFEQVNCGRKYAF